VLVREIIFMSHTFKCGLQLRAAYINL